MKKLLFFSAGLWRRAGWWEPTISGKVSPRESLPFYIKKKNLCVFVFPVSLHPWGYSPRRNRIAWSQRDRKVLHSYAAVCDFEPGSEASAFTSVSTERKTQTEDRGELTDLRGEMWWYWGFSFEEEWSEQKKHYSCVYNSGQKDQ